MTKYSKAVSSIRKITRDQLISFLIKKPQTIEEILKFIQSNNESLCDDSIPCVCGKKTGTYPEWKHQVRWGLQDLKYNKKIDRDQQTKKYFLK